MFLVSSIEDLKSVLIGYTCAAGELMEFVFKLDKQHAAGTMTHLSHLAGAMQLKKTLFFKYLVPM